MATKKDLVEAHAFSRRRLVTAFLSGAPGGREVEPARPGRTIVGGIALAVLLIAAAAIASVLASKTEEDWNQVGLVVSREEAAPYVILEESDDPELIPILNITSAQLILGADIEPTYVEQDVIEQQTPGETIGIFGAPQTLPRPDRFITDDWTACTADERGMTLGLQTDPDVRSAPGAGVVVSNQGSSYVVARSGDGSEADRAYLYPLPGGGDVDAMLDDLGLESTVQATAVPEDWLRLFPSGGELGWSSFGITDPGTKPDDPTAYPPSARVGDYWEDGDEGLVLTRTGPMRLTPFAFQVYLHTPVPARDPSKPGSLPVPVVGDLPRVTETGPTFTDANWPEEVLEPLTDEPCAQLRMEPGKAPGVELMQGPGDDLSAETVEDSERIEYVIEDGRGAFVYTGDWDDETSQTAFVIDPRGTAYSLLDTLTIEKLGYDEDPAALVPDAWVELFARGVDLSTSRALCPPSTSDAPDEDCRELPS